MVVQPLALRYFSASADELPSFRANLARPEALEAALALTRQPYYHGVFEKAGALFRSMVKNHPFVDGNKRLGLATTFAFLALNGRVLIAPTDEMVAFTTELAATRMEWSTAARWLRARTLWLEDAEEAPGVSPATAERARQLAALLRELPRGDA